MSKTISFVASDELAEWLESEANDRMMTVSSTAQILLAEHVQGCEETTETTETKPEESEQSHDVLQFLERHSDVWKEMPPESASKYAVRVPEDSGLRSAGSFRYMDSLDGVLRNLERWHE